MDEKHYKHYISLSHIFGEIKVTAYEYYYKIFDGSSCVEIEKIAKNQSEIKPPLFWALVENQPPRKKLRLPILLGNINGRVRYLDVSRGNLLVAGRTRSGKTCFLHSALLGLFFTCHPEFLKVVCLDPKKTSFQNFREREELEGFRSICNVATDMEGITRELIALEKEMMRRFTILEEEISAPKNISVRNSIAYRDRDEKKVLPHIVVIFDEFADYKNRIKGTEFKEDGERCMESLAAMGIAAGIHLIFSTQTPYVKYIPGSLKANMQYRISFALSDMEQVRTVLGHARGKKDFCASKLRNGGYFILKGDGKGAEREEGRAFECSWECLINVAKNLREGGYDFSLKRE